MPDYEYISFISCSVCGSNKSVDTYCDRFYCSKCLSDVLRQHKESIKRGGKREGSGRPKGQGRWGCYDGKLKRVYVPEQIADDLPEFVQAVVELLQDFDAQTSDYPESPRKKLARQMVNQLKAIVTFR